MGKHIWDYDDGDLLYTIDNKIAVDSEGHEMYRVSDDYSVDLSTDELHYTPSWDEGNF